MSWRDYLLVATLGLAAALATAFFQASPGYMDADYYFQGGLRLAGGQGFTEMILWNYLSEPDGLPYPSHAYWMPLTSILAALGMQLTGTLQFSTARLGFLLLAGVIPCITAAFSYSLTGRRELARISGLLAAFSGFYLPYLATIDSFGPYILFGAAFIFLAGLACSASDSYPSTRDINGAQGSRRIHKGVWSALLLGIISGLMHLTRADGILWLGMALLLAAFQAAKKNSPSTRLRHVVLGLFLCLAGYLLIMGPWLVRNFMAFNAALAPGSGRALWITQYDELFIYPASILTPRRWLATGLAEILKARLWAAGLNLQTALAVQGEIFLAPLVLLGLWRLRRDARVITAGIAWLLTFLLMTVIFPYQGGRGGFFHSGAALQIVFWVAAPLGLEAIVAWVGRLRRWDIPRAQRFFSFGLVGLAILLTGLVVPSRIFGSGRGQIAWNESYHKYLQVEQGLLALGASTGEIVLVNNPPGYFIASGRPSIAIPFGDVETLLDVASRYQADYLLLEFNQLQGPDDLYNRPGDRSGLQYLDTVADVRIYRITSP